MVGRDLKTTLIVDNTPENFMYQKDNGISIKTWVLDYRDRALEELSMILLMIAEAKPEDIREELRKYRDELKVKVAGEEEIDDIMATHQNRQR